MKKINVFFISSIFFILISCATNFHLKNRYKNLEGKLRQNKAVQALEELRKQRGNYSDNDKVLYLLDQGILSFYSKDEDGAIRDFQEAERQIEENYTKSISKALLSAVSNDYALDYFGEDYENVYLNVFKALAFLEKNNEDAAFVEIRKMHEKFKELSVRYAEELSRLEKEGVKGKKGKIISSGDYPFTDSALSRFLSLILYRSDDRPDDAAIDWRKLKELWSSQSFLYPNSVDYLNALRTELPKDSAILDIVALCDAGPYKYAWELEAISLENTVKISGKNPDFEYIFQYDEKKDISFKFSIPKIAERKENIDRVDVYLNDRFRTTLYEMENFGRTAVNNFQNNNTVVIIKSFLRGLGKALLAREATKDLDKKKKKEDNLFASFLSTAIKSAINSTEQADLRCWRLMPGRAEIGELLLPFGSYKIRLDFIGRNGTVIKSVEETRQLSQNKKLNVVTAYAY